MGNTFYKHRNQFSSAEISAYRQRSLRHITFYLTHNLFLRSCRHVLVATPISIRANIIFLRPWRPFNTNRALLPTCFLYFGMRVGQHGTQLRNHVRQTRGQLFWGTECHGSQQFHRSGLCPPRIFCQRTEQGGKHQFHTMCR